MVGKRELPRKRRIGRELGIFVADEHEWHAQGVDNPQGIDDAQEACRREKDEREPRQVLFGRSIGSLFSRGQAGRQARSSKALDPRREGKGDEFEGRSRSFRRRRRQRFGRLGGAILELEPRKPRIKPALRA